MRKLFLLIMLFVLAACAAPDETQTNVDAVVDDADPVPTESPKAGTASRPAAVSADPITPAETAAEAGVIRDRDWTKGAADPLITIIEYGDFQ